MAASSEGRVAVVRLTDGIVAVHNYEVFNDCTAAPEPEPWLPLAIAPPAELPFVHPHPTEREWLLADGGLWRVDGAGEVSLVLAGQVRQAIYAADPRQLVALVEPEAPGALGPGIEVLVGPPDHLAPVFTHPWLRTGTLAAVLPPNGFATDQDADGIADIADRCPDVPEMVRPPVDLGEHLYLQLALAAHDDYFLLAQSDRVQTGLSVWAADG
ncbi:MAG: hypothetical protein KC620_16895, partial [Myxococcales bacterium]|nr:hypothetical protein [Myxococcales bacterium]